ncbi:unnamed protein product [Caenorhabditis auriculariae]|uniref:F-box domain-containing protein n=1 Tax=Caenorhabditis auriculariae TaxID=2777116 RepID=A0A8S1GMI9_9PELO|nr:unnamed protein product [Caenorhabditis auriculariae]
MTQPSPVSSRSSCRKGNLSERITNFFGVRKRLSEAAHGKNNKRRRTCIADGRTCLSPASPFSVCDDEVVYLGPTLRSLNIIPELRRPTPMGIFDNVPEDLVHLLVSKIPMIELARLSSVSKSWMIYLKDYTCSALFESRFLRDCNSSRDPASFYTRNDSFYSLGIFLRQVTKLFDSFSERVDFLVKFLRKIFEKIRSLDGFGRAIFSFCDGIQSQEDYDKVITSAMLIDKSIYEDLNSILDSPWGQKSKLELKVRVNLTSLFLNHRGMDFQHESNRFWLSALMNVYKKAGTRIQSKLLYLLFAPMRTQGGQEVVHWDLFGDFAVQTHQQAISMLRDISSALQALMLTKKANTELSWTKNAVFNLMEEVTTFPTPWSMNTFVSLLLVQPCLIPISITARMFRQHEDEAGDMVHTMKTLLFRWGIDCAEHLTVAFHSIATHLGSFERKSLSESIWSWHRKNVDDLRAQNDGFADLNEEMRNPEFSNVAATDRPVFESSRVSASIDVGRLVSDLRSFVVDEKTVKVIDAVNCGKRTLDVLLARNGHSIHSLSRRDKLMYHGNKNYTIDSNGRVCIVKASNEANRNRELLHLSSENQELRALHKDLMCGLELVMKKHRHVMAEYSQHLLNARPKIPKERVDDVVRKNDEEVKGTFVGTGAAVNFVVAREEKKEILRKKLFKRLQMENFVMRALLKCDNMVEAVPEDIAEEWRIFKESSNPDESMETVIENSLTNSDSLEETFPFFLCCYTQALFEMGKEKKDVKKKKKNTKTKTKSKPKQQDKVKDKTKKKKTTRKPTSRPEDLKKKAIVRSKDVKGKPKKATPSKKSDQRLIPKPNTRRSVVRSSVPLKLTDVDKKKKPISSKEAVIAKKNESGKEGKNLKEEKKIEVPKKTVVEKKKESSDAKKLRVEPSVSVVKPEQKGGLVERKPELLPVDRTQLSLSKTQSSERGVNPALAKLAFLDPTASKIANVLDVRNAPLTSEMIQPDEAVQEPKVLVVDIDSVSRTGAVLERHLMSIDRKRSFDWLAMNRHAATHPSAFSKHLGLALCDVGMDTSLVRKAFGHLQTLNVISAKETDQVQNCLDRENSPITVASAARILKKFCSAYA